MNKFLIMLTSTVCLLASNVFAFDPPDCGDPWYYQSDDKGLTFMVPDKAQHYWGSYLLSEVSQKYLGDKAGPLITFALGFFWEVKDSKTSLGTVDGGVVGFSYKDLLADGVGILSSAINRRGTLKLWMDYSTLHKEITFNVSLKL